MDERLRLQTVMQAIYSTPWAIMSDKLSAILAVVHFHAEGGTLTAEEIQQRIGAARERPKLRANGDIAILPLVGTIAHRMGLMSESSGGTSVESFTKDFRAAINDPSVAAIVLDVDSPGGTVSGVDELSSEIYAARGIKPISAVANSLAASAAYWIACACDEIAVSPSAQVGSIGVIAAHQDQSAMMDMLGVKTTLVSAGKYKAENSPFEPLTDEGRAALQKRVDESYTMFTKRVATNRGVGVAAVRDGYGQGRVVGAQEAVALGMADRVATLDDVVATIGRRRATQPQTGAYMAPAALSFESESEAVLTTVRAFEARVRALTALRTDRPTPVSQANMPRLAEHRAALMTLADAYGALLSACTPVSQDALRALESAFLATNARRLRVPLEGA